MQITRRTFFNLSPILACGFQPAKDSKPTVYMFTADYCAPCKTFQKQTVEGKTWLSLISHLVASHKGKPYREVGHMINDQKRGYWALDSDWRKAEEGLRVVLAFQRATNHKKPQIVMPTFWIEGTDKYLEGL